MPADCPELGRFLRGEIPTGEFRHRDHVCIGFEMLKRYDFPETVLHFSRTLRAMARKAGRPEAFHQTVTIAFLSLIAERMDAGHGDDFEAFARANPDLLEKSALGRWYGAERLGSAAARRTFLLPDAAPHRTQPPDEHPPVPAALPSARETKAE